MGAPFSFSQNDIDTVVSMVSAKMPARAIAEALGVSTKTVSSWLAKGRAHAASKEVSDAAEDASATEPWNVFYQAYQQGQAALVATLSAVRDIAIIEGMPRFKITLGPDDLSVVGRVIDERQLANDRRGKTALIEELALGGKLPTATAIFWRDQINLQALEAAIDRAEANLGIDTVKAQISTSPEDTVVEW